MGPTVIPLNKCWSLSRYLLATKLTSSQKNSDENSHQNKLNTASVEWVLGEVLTPQLVHWITKHLLAVSTVNPNYRFNNNSKTIINNKSIPTTISKILHHHHHFFKVFHNFIF